MYNATDGMYLMEQSKKDRMNNYQEIRTRLEGEEGSPMLYATENCLHFWRTMPELQLDQRQPEKGVDTAQEDHMYDVVAYACASRPYITTRRERAQAAFREAKRKILHNK